MDTVQSEIIQLDITVDCYRYKATYGTVLYIMLVLNTYCNTVTVL